MAKYQCTECIVKFCTAMELKLREHDAEKGYSFKEYSIEWLESKLKEEFNEVIHAPFIELDKSELVDLANICMMLWYRKTQDEYKGE